MDCAVATTAPMELRLGDHHSAAQFRMPMISGWARSGSRPERSSPEAIASANSSRQMAAY